MKNVNKVNIVILNKRNIYTFSQRFSEFAPIFALLTANYEGTEGLVDVNIPQLYISCAFEIELRNNNNVLIIEVYCTYVRRKQLRCIFKVFILILKKFCKSFWSKKIFS